MSSKLIVDYSLYYWSWLTTYATESPITKQQIILCTIGDSVAYGPGSLLVILLLMVLVDYSLYYNQSLQLLHKQQNHQSPSTHNSLTTYELIRLIPIRRRENVYFRTHLYINKGIDQRRAVSYLQFQKFYKKCSLLYTIFI